MAGESPNREVSLDFTVKGDAETKAGHLGKALEHVQHAAETASARVASFGKSAAVGALGAMGLSYGLRGLWDHAKDVNLSLESMQKRLAGATFAFSTWKAGTSGISKWNESMRDGAAILEKLEAVSKREKISREDLSSIYDSQSMMSERYRQSQSQQIALTERLAATQNVLGVSAEAAGEMIGRAAMTGAIPLRSSLGRELAAGVGNLKAFKHASEEVRFEKLKKALGDMVPASVAMGQGMKGALFDIHEAATMLTRDLSAPLFAAQTQSLREWAASLTRVREDGKSIAHEYGEKIAKAFTLIKDVSGGIAQHWKLIAGMLVAGKVGGMMGGVSSWLGAAGGGGCSTAAGGAAGVMNVRAATVNVNGTAATTLGSTTAKAIGEELKPGLLGTVGKLAGFASKLGLATEAAGALYLAAGTFAKWTEDKKSQQVAESQKLDLDTMTTLSGKALSQYLHMSGLGKAGENKTAVEAAFAAMSTADRERWSKKLGLQDIIRQPIAGIGGAMMNAGYGSIVQNTNPEALAKAFGESVADSLMRASPLFGKGLGVLAPLGFSMLDGVEATDKEKAKKAVGDIHIGTLNLTQDFKEANPEHVFHQVISDINQLGHAPGQALTARGGR